MRAKKDRRADSSSVIGRNSSFRQRKGELFLLAASEEISNGSSHLDGVKSSSLMSRYVQKIDSFSSQSCIFNQLDGCIVRIHG